MLAWLLHEWRTCYHLGLKLVYLLAHGKSIFESKKMLMKDDEEEGEYSYMFCMHDLQRYCGGSRLRSDPDRVPDMKDDKCRYFYLLLKSRS